VRVHLPGGVRLHGWQVVVIPLLALLTVLAVVLSLLGWLPGQGGSTATAGPTRPTGGATATASPSSTPVASAAAQTLVLAPASDAGPAPTTAGLAAELSPLLRDKGLGKHVGGAVVDLSTGQLAYGSDASGAFAPASTTKLLTAAAALSTLGPQFRIQTKVVAGSAPGQIILVGGGDPTLSTSAPAGFVPAPASISELAAATAAALRKAGTTKVTLGYDTTLFAGPRTAQTWPSTYVSTGVVAPVTALSLDEGRVGAIVEGTAPRVPDPPVSAAEAFARRLTALGITVTGAPTAVTAPPAPAAPAGSTASQSATGSASSAGASPSAVPVAPGSLLASVRSPALSDLVSWMLSTSDNDLAEAVAHLTAIAAGQPADFDGGVTAVTNAVGALGLPTGGLRLYDGSGLTGSTQGSPALLADVLAVADSPAHAVLRPLLTGLAVAGFSGSLTTRFDDPGTRQAAGLVRGKSGTLSTVSAIAGTVLDADGHELAFVFIADQVTPGTTLAARAALDRLAAAVAGCGCR
jgi:serine-type D-Ala-D-Ala carboxypeptidase/endopeptidase (penicillin-binding protein 4)